MAQPLYFLPGLQSCHVAPGNRLARTILAERGLAAVFADLEATDKDCGVNAPSAIGPGGKSGCYLWYQRPSDAATPRRTAYYPQEQTWHQASDGLWIGIDNSSPPMPEDLERKKKIGGYQIVLADGHSWQIPVIRRDDGQTELPGNWIRNGHWERVIKPQYRDLWERSAVVADWYFGKGRQAESFTLDAALDRAVEALAVNYRFDANLQNILGVLDTTNWELVLAATVDLPQVMAASAELQKKSEGETPDSAST